MMKIIINGQEKKLPEATTLNNIVETFCKDTVHIIAELNGNIVKQPNWPGMQVKDGDSIELIKFVGGG